MSIKKLTDHITRITFKKLYSVCVWAVSFDDGYLLVDTGFKDSDVEKALIEAGFNDEPKAIVITHCHLDHTGSAAGLSKKWGVPVVASAGETPFIEARRSLSGEAKGTLQRGFLSLTDRFGMMTGAPVQVTRQVSDGDQIECLRVIEIPGHTPGQIALAHDEDRAVIAGDAFVNNRNRIRQDPMPGIDIDSKVAKRSIEKLAELGYENILPSHGEPLLGDGHQRLKNFLRD